MTTQASLLVRKPQIQFSQRLTDPDLHRLTVAQLRKKARGKKLDVSLLSEKWEFIHVLVQERKHGMKAFAQHVTDTKRRTIFDLPGEIRNTIYSYVLSDASIMAQYDYAVRRFKHKHISSWSQDLVYDSLLHCFCIDMRAQLESPVIAQLRNMSWVNRRLREEVRGFFFANNRFYVVGNKATSHGDFLNDIGADERANIATLELCGYIFWRYNHNFESMVVTCAALRDLSIRMHAGHILTRSGYESLREFADDFCPELVAMEQIDFEIGDRIALFSRLPVLNCLKLECAVPSWPVHEGALFSPFSQDEPVFKAMHLALETALSEALEQCLKGKDISFTIDVVVGPPELSTYMEG
jgi:hypothetical protein